jgi:hypothetical protein
MRRRGAAIAIAVVAAGLVAGCTSPVYDNGRLQCASGHRCPNGFGCIANHCWRIGTGPAAGSCATSQALLCDGFENVLEQQWTPHIVDGSLTLDPTRAYRGQSSIHLHTDSVGSGSTPSATIFESRTFPQSIPVYVRVWAYLASPFPGGFNQVINLVDNGMAGISFATKNGFPVLNAYTQPIVYHESTTLPVPTDRWTCLQLQVAQGAATGDVHLAVDGVEPSDAIGHDVVTTTMRGIYLGLDFLSSDGNAADLWLDEVAVDTKPIPCSD